MKMSPALKKYFCSPRILRNIIKLTIGVGLISIIYVWTNQPETSKKGSSISRRTGKTVAIQWTKENISDEQRIAQQFEIDTLPGLMRHGLIKKSSGIKPGLYCLLPARFGRGDRGFLRIACSQRYWCIIKFTGMR